MEFKSINPYNGEVLQTFASQSKEEVQKIIEQAGKAFKYGRDVPVNKRSKMMKKAGSLLNKNVEKYATTISLEMGKPICEARAEVKKCAWACEFYAENAEEFLADEIIKTDAFESFISYDPLGCILAIMPWNFPFWQVFRFAAPNLMSGNVALLKHASNVFGCAKHIENIFKEAGFPEGSFQNLFIHHDEIETIIASNIVRAVTLTGSEKAGSSVASLAGKYIKKSVLELGGSNAFIVLADADIDKAVQIGIPARMQNGGQSCIAAKRFIVVNKVYDEFVSKFTAGIKDLKSGAPLEEDTQIGTLARKDLAEKLDEQIQASVKQGAKILTGGNFKDAYFEPTVIVNITVDMPVFQEETFGPVAPIMRVKNEEEAFAIAGKTNFGLGSTLFTTDIDRARKQVSKVADGSFFINDLVKSDPRLPFGGTKQSGYGRELSKEGMLEFVNIKTVYVKE
ncbi:MAG: NAD-dependent succinate-semialdehyde dehydrogenase [Bacteroidota bacterium]|nr:NAD-dependent succinate-semialdehyde dehydrogenase [Bacteroidota bacterium]